RLVLRRNIYAHNAKIYRARKEGRSSPQRRSHLVVLTLRNLSPNRSQKRPIYHLNCESQARLRAPVRAYSSAIPLSTRKPPIVLVTAKLAAPCSDSHSSVLYPHNANAEALISSKKTNMLKASPGKLNPHIAARNMSTSTW